ncbi:unnamed protein product [Angiostrongylus costaricensis]|uniref:Secreted protein n=1 Tax=Angiostrongylus costaricensis TaxID=334426 RepID=A0A0R3PKF4_ANGCS|nr:unnamed protein product [Angiostrongylus costaricensis]
MMLLVVMLLVLTPANADWWDSLTNTVSDGFMSIGKWVKETASPTVRKKFNNVKEVLQDPRTHQRIREFVSEVKSFHYWCYLAHCQLRTELIPDLLWKTLNQ